MTDKDTDAVQANTATQPKVEGLYMALELMELAYELVRQRFIRENPSASDDAVLQHINAWANSPRNGTTNLKNT
ncbi:MAG: hypothetical protein ACK5Y2_14305 [Bdellovibrionales bacterium]|jgi:hypothetical protein